MADFSASLSLAIKAHIARFTLPCGISIKEIEEMHV